ncbi:MAG: hypothetical protein ABSH05_07460 [Bryobacteraceae bacterium]
MGEAMPLRTVLSCCLLLAAAVKAQKLENTGAPMRVLFQCTEEDIRAFGLTCPSRQPCPVYLELAALDSSAGRIFLTGDLHTESATLFSILLASEDDGKTWYEPYQRIRSAGLDQIQFFDLESGWIGGQQLGAIPRDPFLLVTRDGGKLWHAAPVYEESRAGAIEAFRFDSKSHGWLWIDRTQSGEAESRYEMLESQTGGESWMLREVSDHPIAGKPRPAPPSAGFRLRPDAATKSYRVEQQTGERWQPLASFLVRVGECKEAEVILEPEPPATEAAPTPCRTGSPSGECTGSPEPAPRPSGKAGPARPNKPESDRR